MSMRQRLLDHVWDHFSDVVKKRALHPQYAGYFTVEQAESNEMRLVVGKEGSLELGAVVYLYWLVDETDGIIADAKFQVFGPPTLIAAADISCQLVLRKTYDQASRIRSDLIDQEARESKSQQAFPDENERELHMIISAMDQAAKQCMDIPFAEDYTATPIASGDNTASQVIENFFSIPKEEQIKVIEEVVDKEIRPYIELDAGGIEIQDIEGNIIKITYSGACVSCPSSIGSTLSAIQNILQTRVHPNLSVAPDF